MTELCKLAEKYGTDKLGAYTRFYGWFLKPFRESVRKVLEIGIGNVADMKHVPGYQPGASLRMWRDFFPNAAIHGIDIDPEVLMHDERIETFLVSQINPHQLAAFGKEHGPFDLIIDDGDHHPGPQAQLIDEQKIVVIETGNSGDEFSRALRLSMVQTMTPAGPAATPQGAVVRAGWRHYN
jgi:hypothetical protein